MISINIVFLDLKTYEEWISSIPEDLNYGRLKIKFEKITEEENAISEKRKKISPVDYILAFVHARNFNADTFAEKFATTKTNVVYFSGGSIEDSKKESLTQKLGERIHFIENINHNGNCPWFFKDFFDDWVERDGPEKAIPNFDILEKGNSQVAIDTLHKLREVILTPFTALHLLLQTDTTSAEIGKIFKDTKGNKIDINDHISKSKSTLNALQKASSLNNIPSADRLPEFSDEN